MRILRVMYSVIHICADFDHRPKQQPAEADVKLHKLTFYNLGYSAFLRGDVILHPSTGCKLSLDYVDTMSKIGKGKVILSRSFGRPESQES